MSLTSYQAAPPCNKGEEEGASLPKKCQRLSLLQADPDLGVSDIGILKGEGHGGLRQLLYPDPDRLDLGLGVLDLHREDVALLVELRAHGELDRSIHGHDSAYLGHAYRALEKVFRDIGQRNSRLRSLRWRRLQRRRGPGRHIRHPG